MRALLILGLLSLPTAVSAQSAAGTQPIPEAGIDQKLGQSIPLDLMFRDEAVSRCPWEISSTASL